MQKYSFFVFCVHTSIFIPSFRGKISRKKDCLVLDWLIGSFFFHNCYGAIFWRFVRITKSYWPTSTISTRCVHWRRYWKSMLDRDMKNSINYFIWFFFYRFLQNSTCFQDTQLVLRQLHLIQTILMKYLTSMLLLIHLIIVSCSQFRGESWWYSQTFLFCV